VKHALCNVDPEYAHLWFHWTRLLWLYGFTDRELIVAHCSRSAQGRVHFITTQRLRHFANHIAPTVGEDHGKRVRHWFAEKKAGWYAVLEDPKMPAMSTVLDQAHNAIDRKLFAMKGFHHSGGSQAAFLTGLAHLYNLIPYQRRAKNAGLCGVQVEGGRVPTSD
jgi:hypothetical protein